MTALKRFNTWMALGAGTFEETKPLGPTDTRKPGGRISAQIDFFFADADEAFHFMQLFKGGMVPVVIREGHDQVTTHEEGSLSDTPFVPWTGTFDEEVP